MGPLDRDANNLLSLHFGWMSAIAFGMENRLASAYDCIENPSLIYLIPLLSLVHWNQSLKRQRSIRV